MTTTDIMDTIGTVEQSVRYAFAKLALAPSQNFARLVKVSATAHKAGLWAP